MKSLKTLAQITSAIASAMKYIRSMIINTPKEIIHIIVSMVPAVAILAAFKVWPLELIAAVMVVTLGVKVAAYTHIEREKERWRATQRDRDLWEKQLREQWESEHGE